jgi:CRP-like cAMP-binding protein
MIDFEQLKTVYKFGLNLSLADIQVLLKPAAIKSFTSGEYLIKEGAIKKEIFFIRKGLVRAYVINAKGDEITTLIRSENQFVLSTDVILFNQASKSYYEAIEPTDVFVIDHDILQSLINQNPRLEANRKFVFQNILKEAITRMDSFVLLSPKERYIQFVQSNPDIINRVPLKYIANILGMTAVSLSRIRKRIATNKQ